MAQLPDRGYNISTYAVGYLYTGGQADKQGRLRPFAAITIG